MLVFARTRQKNPKQREAARDTKHAQRGDKRRQLEPCDNQAVVPVKPARIAVLHFYTAVVAAEHDLRQFHLGILILFYYSLTLEYTDLYLDIANILDPHEIQHSAS